MQEISKNSQKQTYDESKIKFYSFKQQKLETQLNFFKYDIKIVKIGKYSQVNITI